VGEILQGMCGPEVLAMSIPFVTQKDCFCCKNKAPAAEINGKETIIEQKQRIP
jgi:hypothetical protein